MSALMPETNRKNCVDPTVFPMRRQNTSNQTPALRTVQHEVRDPNLVRLVWLQDAEDNPLIKSGDPGRWHGMVWGPLVHFGMV